MGSLTSGVLQPEVSVKAKSKTLPAKLKTQLTSKNLIAGAKPSCQQLSNLLSSTTKKNNFCQTELKNEVIDNNNFLDA